MTHFAWTYAFGPAHGAGLWRSEKAATIAEYGIIAALAVTAWSAAESPRFQTVKDPSSHRAACLTSAQRGPGHRWDKPMLPPAPHACKAKGVGRV